MRHGPMVMTLIILVASGWIAGCDRTPLVPRLSGNLVGGTTGQTAQDGTYIAVIGKVAVFYATDRPTVLFGAVESGATDQTIDTWTIPWVILDRTADLAHEVLQGGSSSSDYLVEVEFQYGRTGDKSQVVSIQWAVDCSRAPAVVRSFRFDSEEVDLTRGSLLILQRNGQGNLELEQRVWKGQFAQELSGSKSSSFYIPIKERSQGIADSILQELGY
ncbi:MAG: hypothetical protein VX764_05900 [Planctomycetota bacterium]|nr:hypothetical protein [Planctomycetota bacterium]